MLVNYGLMHVGNLVLQKPFQSGIWISLVDLNDIMWLWCRHYPPFRRLLSNAWMITGYYQDGIQLVSLWHEELSIGMNGDTSLCNTRFASVQLCCRWHRPCITPHHPCRWLCFLHCIHNKSYTTCAPGQSCLSEALVSYFMLCWPRLPCNSIAGIVVIDFYWLI
jgi:hypothetical protein